MIDASSGGALMHMTPKKAWELIETVADATQHFNRRAPEDRAVARPRRVDARPDCGPRTHVLGPAQSHEPERSGAR
ncbi:hypothetical protein PIB30_069355 [Stylosanthes scabra]|uniref:Uncharacterized protein n=1 Tax=Stylosanthes scabra TaxID=79078 RepID=A0ABU6YM52_9FABA|nr:hypothetical protein [Stylosanthes scabra]